ncbi:hypothetical protein [Isoalcanivorax beigongshangi]|uniref:Lipoprotein n=1 Tax=Isoalcanivorax beigongshangi TaxID=3238810 RepID=A0ABV4AEV3_9GAMM
MGIRWVLWWAGLLLLTGCQGPLQNWTDEKLGYGTREERLTGLLISADRSQLVLLTGDADYVLDIDPELAERLRNPPRPEHMRLSRMDVDRRGRSHITLSLIPVQTPRVTKTLHDTPTRSQPKPPMPANALARLSTELVLPTLPTSSEPEPSPLQQHFELSGRRYQSSGVQVPEALAHPSHLWVYLEPGRGRAATRTATSPVLALADGTLIIAGATLMVVTITAVWAVGCSSAHVRGWFTGKPTPDIC